MITPPGPFDYEKHSLRWTLQQLMADSQDIDSLCRYVPRIANAFANVSRIEHALKGERRPDAFETFQQALQELIEERLIDEEES